MKNILLGLILALLPTTLYADSNQVLKVLSLPNQNTPYLGYFGILCDTEKHTEYIIIQFYPGNGGAVGITPRVNGNYCS